MIRTQIQLTEEQMRGLKRVAVERGMSISAVVREALGSHLTVDETDAKWRRALATAGRFGSGERDVSVEHDRYLAEDFA